MHLISQTASQANGKSVRVSPYFHGEQFYQLVHQIRGRLNVVVTVFF